MGLVWVLRCGHWLVEEEGGGSCIEYYLLFASDDHEL